MQKNQFGEIIPPHYVTYQGYAWWLDGEHVAWTAPTNTDGSIDWDNIGEPCDFTAFTQEHLVELSSLLGSMPVNVIPGAFFRP